MARASKNQLAKFFYRLATSYSAGIDLRAAIQRETQTGAPAYRRMMRDMLADIESGVSLTKAFKNRGEFFPQLVLAVTRAGEKGGRLDEAFRRLAAHYDSLVKFRNRFLVAISWPVFELVLAVGILGLLILVLGFIYDMNNMRPVDWFGLRRLGLEVGTTGNFVIYVMLVMAVAAGIVAFAVGMNRGWFGLYPMRIARRLPLIGPTIEALSLSRFAWTASIAENAGMEAGETMELALQSTQNYYYERLIPQVTEGVRSGRQFFPVLDETKAFPQDLLLLVDNGETSGQLAETMERGSEQLQEKAESNLKIIAQVGFFLTLMFVGVVMAFTIISLYYQLVISPTNEILREMGY
jgi:type II secretory pathway component PulF